MYARTVSAFILEFVKDGELAIDFEDEVIKGSCVSHDGKVVNDRVASALNIHSN